MRLEGPAARLVRQVLAAMLVSPALAAQSGPDLVLWNVTVIDGRGGPPVSGQAVTVRDGRIATVAPVGGDRVPSGAIDLAGHWLIPGLIDSHVHLPPIRDSVESRLARLLERGITSVRDLAGDALLYQELGLRAADPTTRASIFYAAFFAGPSWFALDPRPRGATRGRPPGAVPWFLAVTDSTHLDAAVADARRLGATGIKLYSDLSLAFVRHATREAHRQGLMAWSHPAVFPVRPSEVVRAGVDVVSHAALLIWEAVDSPPPRFHTDPWTNFGPVGPYPRVPPDTAPVRRVLSLMKEHGTVLDATVSTIASGISPAAAEWACAVTRGAHRMGVPVSTGTDRRITMTPAGRPAVLDEMAYLVEHCGFTPLEVITAATLNGARTIGQADHLGTIEAGRIADLVVLRADPVADLEHLTDVAYVVKAGRVVVPLPERR